jgi:5-methylcytosine-specific restriction protein A
VKLKHHKPLDIKDHRITVPTLSKTVRVRGYALQKRNRRLSFANPLCVKCKAEGVTRVAVEWDHIVPLSRGGGEVEGNLQGLCRPHHEAKSREELRR